ncbi:MAG TPA: NUDIX domain-containing protein [Pseudonocardiaceae bacterium]
MDVTVDVVVLSVLDGRLSVLLVRRALEPFRGRWALPGGFVRDGEDLPGAAARELAEETGLTSPAAHLEQLASYGAPDRDPRGRVVTVAYLALVPGAAAPSGGYGGYGGPGGRRGHDEGQGGGHGGGALVPRGGGDAADAAWVAVEDVAGLAFDHAAILADGVERARAKLEYTPLAAAFCPPEFTVAQLRQVYECVWGVPLDPRNFHRKVTGALGFLEPTGRSTEGHPGRPAQLYRAGSATLLHPPMLRP